MNKQDKIRKMQIQKKLGHGITDSQYYALIDMAKKIMTDSKKQFLKGENKDDETQC